MMRYTLRVISILRRGQRRGASVNFSLLQNPGRVVRELCGAWDHFRG
jgi:hypothetical protein